jgi:hypothetical protein
LRIPLSASVQRAVRPPTLTMRPQPAEQFGVEIEHQRVLIRFLDRVPDKPARRRRTIYEDVDSAESLDGPVDERLYLRHPGGVGGDPFDLSARFRPQLRRCTIERRLRPRRDDDLGSGEEQLARCFLADTNAAAGNDRNLA